MRLFAAICMLFIAALTVTAQDNPRRVRDLEDKVAKLEEEVAKLKAQVAELLRREQFRSYKVDRLTTLAKEGDALAAKIEAGDVENKEEAEKLLAAIWDEHSRLEVCQTLEEAQDYLTARSEKLTKQVERLTERIAREERQVPRVRAKIEALKAQRTTASKELSRVNELITNGAAVIAPVDNPPRTTEPKPTTQVVWQVDINSDVKGSGAVADINGDGRLELVFGSYFGDQQLYCLDAASGVVKWKHASDGGPLDASVSIFDLDRDGKLDVLSADSSTGSLYALNSDGTQKYTLKLPSGTDSPCAIGDVDGDGIAEIVVGTMWGSRDAGRKNGCVCCYSTRSRRLIWQKNYPGCVQSEPMLVDLNNDRVLDVITTSWRGDNGIHALNGRDGEPLWTFTTEGNEKSMGMYHGVALNRSQDKIYAVTCQGDLYALNLKGEKLWSKHYDDYLFAPISMADMDQDGHEDLVFGGKKIYCVCARDGADNWSANCFASLERGVAFCDADGDGDIDAIFNDGRAVRALDGKTGVECLRYDATFKGKQWEQISSAPILGDFDGDGRIEYFFVIGVGTSENNFRDNYGRAMCIKLPGRSGNWPTFRSNMRRTGNQSH